MKREGAQYDGRARLKKLGLSNRRIAVEIGVSPPTVGGWKNGRWVPEHVHQQALERKYGIPVASWPPRPPPAKAACPDGPRPAKRAGRPGRAASALRVLVPAASLAVCSSACAHAMALRPLGPVTTDEIVAELMARGFPFGEHPDAPKPARVRALAERPHCELVAELTARGFSFTPRSGTPTGKR